MKTKTTTPRTIADLKFDWEFVDYLEGYPSIEIAQEQVSKKNPKLLGFKIVPASYLILIDNRKMQISESKPISVVGFFEIVCFKCSIRSITGKFSHFERIDNQTYRIHMKK